MYSIRIDGKLLYSPDLIDDGYLVLNPKLTLELRKAGSLTFVIPPKNPMYDNVRKLKSIVTVYDGVDEIFRGRVLYDEKDFFNRKKVYCEGELAFLLDSIQRPYEFTGDIPDLFKKFIDSHNEQVEEAKQFVIGEITVTDPNNYINRSNTNYANTWDEITAKLLETHGGYIRPRLKNGTRYIDLVKEYGRRGSQTIEFGKNILDISEYITAENVFTVLIPLGAYPEKSNSSSGGIILSPTCPDCNKTMILEDEDAPASIYIHHHDNCTQSVLSLDSVASEEGDYWIYVCPDCGITVERDKNAYWTYSCPDCGTTVERPKNSDDTTTEEDPKRITIESVNGGKDYIEDDAGIALFGRIVKTHEWDDVTEPENLLNKARALLDASIEMAVTLTMNAVDLHLVDADIERLKLGDSVQVISPPHNIDREFTCSKIVLDLVAPDNSEYTFGATYTTMTEQQSSGSKVIQNATLIAQQASDSANKTNQSLQDYVPNKVYSEDMTQKGIFKVLTNNGAIQGIVFDEATGDAYVNASYIKSGTLTIGGLKSDSSRLEILDNNGELCLVAGPDGIRVVKGEINATSGSLDSVTIMDGITISRTGEEGPKNLSLVKITESDGGAGTVYSITIGEETGRSTPLMLQGSSICIKGASSLTFSADNIIFENAIEAPSAYFDDVHVGNAVHFDLDDSEKQIHFKTQSSAGTYQHNSKIYGGNASSRIAIGVYDYIAGRRVLVYDDQSQHLVSDVVLASNDLDITLGDGASSVDNQSICQQLTHVAHIHANFISSGIAANTTATLGTITSDYAPPAFDVILSAYTATAVCAVFLTAKGHIKIKSPNAIAAGEKIFVDGCWIY